MKFIKYLLSFLCTLSVLLLTAQENDPGWVWAERGGSSAEITGSQISDYGMERIVDLAVDFENSQAIDER